MVLSCRSRLYRLSHISPDNVNGRPINVCHLFHSFVSFCVRFLSSSVNAFLKPWRFAEVLSVQNV